MAGQDPISGIEANRPGASAQIMEMMRDMMNPLRYSSVKVNGAQQSERNQAFAQGEVTLPPATGGTAKFSSAATGQLTNNYDADGNLKQTGSHINLVG